MSTSEKTELEQLKCDTTADYKTYYNASHVLNYRNNCNLHMLVSARGTGKKMYQAYKKTKQN